MRLMETLVVTAVTLSAASISYTQLNPAQWMDRAQGVATQASCRTVDTAITAYAAMNDRDAVSIRDLEDYVQGDISAYRIVDGRAAGPDC